MNGTLVGQRASYTSIHDMVAHGIALKMANLFPPPIHVARIKDVTLTATEVELTRKPTSAVVRSRISSDAFPE